MLIDVLADGPDRARWRAPRTRPGRVRSPLPDFFIGAHALVNGLRLLTRDANRYRHHDPKLEIISP